MTAEQLYHSYYTKIQIPHIGFDTFYKLLKILRKLTAKKGFYFINRYNSKYPFTYLGTYLLARTEFKKSLKYIKTKPIYLPKKKPKIETSWLSRVNLKDNASLKMSLDNSLNLKMNSSINRKLKTDYC